MRDEHFNPEVSRTVTGSSRICARASHAMYRAAYDFTGEVEGTLSLSANERFILLDASNKHWWQVKSSRDGRIGLAPANYLEPEVMTSSSVGMFIGTLNL